MEREPLRPHLIDKAKLPPLFPTHQHDAAFWCSLGRAVATFGFLEQTLKKAILALTGTVPAPEDPEEAAAAVQEWQDQLTRSIVSPLNALIDTFAKAAREHTEAHLQNLDKFADTMRSAARLRNLICHSSWAPPDDSGASAPFYVSGPTGQPAKHVVWEAPVTVAWLDQLRAHAAELACEVMNSVTHMGYQFPGTDSPGRPVV